MLLAGVLLFSLVLWSTSSGHLRDVGVGVMLTIDSTRGAPCTASC